MALKGIIEDGSPLLFYFYITEFLVNWIATAWSNIYAYCLFSAFFKWKWIMRNYWLTKKCRHRLLHCKNLCLHLLSSRVHFIVLYGWKRSTPLDIWIKWWKWEAKRVIAALQSLRSPTHITIKAEVQISWAEGRAVNFLLEALPHSPHCGRAVASSAALGWQQCLQCQAGPHTAQ